MIAKYLHVLRVLATAINNHMHLLQIETFFLNFF